MQRAILKLQFFFFIFLENVIQPSTFLHEDKKTNFYQHPKFEMFLFFFHDLPKNRSYPFSLPLFNILVPIFDPFIVMSFFTCALFFHIYYIFFPLSKVIYSYFLFKFLLFITSWKIDTFLRYLAHVISLHISSIGANIKPFE